jgi:hypothetical protein
MPISRRDLLNAAAASGALLVARPRGVLADLLGPTAEFSTSRASRLFPGTWLAHADLHNHTLNSDGDGDPALAFASMRSAGLDIAALTDHSTVSKGLPGSVCPESNCQGLAGINEASWAEQAALADAADQPGAFTALRGFEWSSPTLGHINVWFSQTWTDPLHTGGASSGEGLAQFLHDEAGLEAEIAHPLDATVRALPSTGVAMELFYRWFEADPSLPLVGGGADGIAGFNHPGREVGRFSYFAYHPSVRDRLVSVEVFNRREDYIFEATELGYPSPINDCLNAGWKTGLLGVTDEHGTDWGYPDGKGRTGLWVTSLDRAGVREAMEARRFFATRLRGLRVDAAANGVRMGNSLDHSSGPVTFELDVDRGPEWTGKELLVQVLRSGTGLPSVTHVERVTVPSADEPVISFTAPVDAADGSWVVLRITDPDVPADGRATGEWTSYGNAVAYASPFFLEVA